jgi:hypothetical protein
VDDFYTKLGGVVITGLEGSARTTPDPLTAAEETTATDLFYVMDAQSRAAGLAAGAVARGGLNVTERLNYAQLVGVYRHQLDALSSRFTDPERVRHDALVNSPAWRLATSTEDTLIQRGSFAGSVADWENATNQVSTQLRGLWGDHFRYSETVAKDAAGRSLLQSILAGSAVLIVAIGAFLIAVRLANALVRRLRLLRAKTLELANDRLPLMVQRLRDGEQVDVDREVDTVDHGSDEIGQVAEAFNTAQRTAIAAAAAEAKTRGGINKVFLDIAHRSQIVVHRQLEVLDVAEAKQSDPEHLQLLFKLDHLATHARRNAENLLILGGGQPGRKWRNPVALEEIVRSAISETEDFARVSAVRLPDVRLLGGVVADLIHLLAELVDNATSFSPPDSPVAVHGNLVGKGVVVEVEDQGLGIGFSEREEFNEMLQHPPDFEAMALAGQRRLGLFVVGRLAARHNISISLLESAYGGIKAIVLIPAKMIAADDERNDTVTMASIGDPADYSRRSARHRQSYAMPPAESLSTNGFEHSMDEWDQWPEEEPADSVSLPPARQSPESVILAARPQSPSPDRRRPPLPRRQRQANLAPQLQNDTPSVPDTPVSESRRARSAEQARNSMASFQRGTRQGRGDSSGQHNR